MIIIIIIICIIYYLLYTRAHAYIEHARAGARAGETQRQKVGYKPIYLVQRYIQYGAIGIPVSPL